MNSSEHRWRQKFAVAIAGVLWAMRRHSSFWIHLPIALTVVAVAAWLRVEPWRWIAIVLAITIVLCAELMNSSIEQMVRVLHPEHDPQLGRALDAAAGGVLVASVGAVVVGLITLCMPIWEAVAALR